MQTRDLISSLKGVWELLDFDGWQKWFGASILGFAFVLGLNTGFSFVQFQGLVIGIPLNLCYNQAINDCFDVEIDRAKEKITGKGPVVSNLISRKAALALTLLVLMIGLTSTFFSSPVLLAFNIAAVSLGTVYSAPPFRLKMKYPFSTLVQFTGCFIPFLAGVTSVGTLTLEAIVISSAFAVLAVVHRFQHEIANYKADIETGKGTIAVVKGFKTANVLRKLFALVGITEFVLFLAFGWINAVFALAFGLYVLVCIAPIWFRFVPKPLKIIPNFVDQFSGFILLFVVLGLYGELGTLRF